MGRVLTVAKTPPANTPPKPRQKRNIAQGFGIVWPHAYVVHISLKHEILTIFAHGKILADTRCYRVSFSDFIICADYLLGIYSGNMRRYPAYLQS